MNNHLITVISLASEACEIDIQFNYGETREYIYGLGDEVYLLEKDREDAPKWVTVPGIAAMPCLDQSGATIVRELFFRILLCDNIIVSFAQTNEADYEALERSRA